MIAGSLTAGLVSVERMVVCWCSAFWLFTMTEYGEPLGISLWAFLAFGAASFLAIRAFLRRPRTMPALMSLGIALAAAGTAGLLWKCSTLPGVTANAFGALAVSSTVYGCVRACTDQPAAARSISAMEGTICFFLAFLWVQTNTGMDARYSAPLLAASLASLLVVLGQRLQAVGAPAGRSRARGFAVVGIALALIAVVLALFLAFGAEPLGQGAVMLFYGVVYCLKLLVWFFNWLLHVLSSLFPAAEGGMAPEPQMTVEIPQEVAEQGDIPPWVLVVLGIAGLCALLGGLVYVMVRLRRFRVGGRTAAVAAGKPERHRMRLRTWLERVLAVLRQRLYLLWMLATQRDSPRALYWFLNRAGRRLGCRRRMGETPCAFVRRAAGLTAELSGDLEALAAALSEELYAPMPRQPFPREAAGRIRRGFRRALRRARRAQAAAWLRRRLAGKTPAET